MSWEWTLVVIVAMVCVTGLLALWMKYVHDAAPIIEEPTTDE